MYSQKSFKSATILSWHKTVGAYHAPFFLNSLMVRVTHLMPKNKRAVLLKLPDNIILKNTTILQNDNIGYF